MSCDRRTGEKHAAKTAGATHQAGHHTSRKETKMKVTNVTAETIEVISDQIRDLRALEYGHTGAECERDPAIMAARADLKETMETYLIQKVGGVENALKAAHQLFDSYCEQIQLAESMLEAPEDWTDEEMYETEEEVSMAGEELAEHCQDVMVVAREIWWISFIGMKEAI